MLHAYLSVPLLRIQSSCLSSNCTNDHSSLLPWRGCVPCLSTSSKQTGTWDPWCAIRSDRNKLVLKPSDGSERGRENGGVASRKKMEHHRHVCMTHGDRCEEDCSTGGSPCATIEDGRSKRVAIESIVM